MNLSVSSVNYRQTPILKKKLHFVSPVCGITVLKKELFIILECSAVVRVFNCDTYVRIRNITVQGMTNPWDIVSRGDMLFVGLFNSDPRLRGGAPSAVGHVESIDGLPASTVCLKNAETSCHSIVTIDLTNMEENNWSCLRKCVYDKTENWKPNSLSMTKEGNLLVCCSAEKMLAEYTPEGKLMRQILIQNRSSDLVMSENKNTLQQAMPYGYNQQPYIKPHLYRGIVYPICRAFHLSNDQFVLVGNNKAWLINNDGNEIGNCDNKKIMCSASCIFADRRDSLLVVDKPRDRLVFLDSSFDTVDIILSQLSSYSAQLTKMHLDEGDGRLYFNDDHNYTVTVMTYY